MNRRAFVQTALAGAAASASASLAPNGERGKWAPLTGEVGITTGGFIRHLTATSVGGSLRLLDVPKLMREELDMRVIDLMTATLPSMEPAYLEQLREAAARAGCLLTNLKMNEPRLDMASADEGGRRHALAEYKRTMDAAARLGVRWVRPLPGVPRPDLALHAAAYRELIDYGASRGITLLIENNGWMRGDPDAIPAVIRAVGEGLRAQPDTGNWTDAARYPGLAQAMPLAASCDFKAFALEPDGEHKAYDLKRCFRIGWDAGFRGPWCIEHAHVELTQQIRETALLRNSLREWMREAGAAS